MEHLLDDQLCDGNHSLHFLCHDGILALSRRLLFTTGHEARPMGGDKCCHWRGRIWNLLYLVLASSLRLFWGGSSGGQEEIAFLMSVPEE